MSNKPTPLEAFNEGVKSATWLVYSREHNLWWRPNFAGYTPVMEQAGRYTREQAERICASAGVGRGSRSEFDEGPPEFCVPDPAAIAECERWKREAMAWRAWEAAEKLVGTEDEVDVNANNAWTFVEQARAANDLAQGAEK